ncbi:ammonium transporter [Gimibacter soli]|uniref:Ammonium transporter n=1 Tax=Gimibacter soli TaxID=3024400 RepID=A0AAE9XRX0_9PROT|nr:ammonium transporter [Gimibacter soli]WCL52850.1 ammonium transporter [Gimibacter soli]
MKSFIKAALMGALFTSLATLPAQAAVDGETQFLLNTFLFIMMGALVMWMAAGFAMLESGLVRSKNVGAICLKNISLFSVACIMFMLCGYNLLYGIDEGGYLGTFAFWAADDSGVLAEGAVIEGGYAAASDFFFQVVFVATAASIVSGTIAERVKLFPFLIFTAILAAVIYPVQASWVWGQGWLTAMGFKDFAGSTLVHSTGGWAALVGAVLLGARRGKYGADGKPRPMPGSNLTLATLGTFILWLGWFGFNGGSQLAFGSAADGVAVSNIILNTNMAACGGVVAAMIVTRLVYGKVDLSMVLNGALAGLVSITASPDTPTLGIATLIGAVGGVLVVFTVPLLDKLKIDDVVGAIPVHLVCGIWGTLAVSITADVPFVTQLIGVTAIGAWVVVASLVAWLALKLTVGIRLSPEEEDLGTDITELGLEAYPEFGRGSQKLV